MEQVVKATHRQLLKIYRDYAKAANLADLVYVSDKHVAITGSTRRFSFTVRPGEHKVG